MKTKLNLKNSTLALIALTTAISNGALAVDRDGVPNGKSEDSEEVTVLPKSKSEVIKSLRNQILSPLDTGDLSRPDAESNPHHKSRSDLTEYESHPFKPSTSREGLPENDPALQDISDLVTNSYTAAELIHRSVEDSKRLPFGPRISFLERRGAEIVQNSDKRFNELLLRYTINRSFDVVSHIRGLAGRNSEEVARFIQLFYEKTFSLAAALAENRYNLISHPMDVAGNNAVEILRELSLAEYGRIYESTLWQFSRSPFLSGSSKTILLMRLLAYLGYDYNGDYRRRERPLGEVITDVYHLQHSPLYGQLIDSIENNLEPDDSKVSWFRSEVFRIMETLVTRNDEANVLSAYPTDLNDPYKGINVPGITPPAVGKPGVSK